jgi:hypothetical protein
MNVLMLVKCEITDHVAINRKWIIRTIELETLTQYGHERKLPRLINDNVTQPSALLNTDLMQTECVWRCGQDLNASGHSAQISDFATAVTFSNKS